MILRGFKQAMCRGCLEAWFEENLFIYLDLRYPEPVESGIVKFSHYGPFLQQSSWVSDKMSRNLAPDGSFSSVFSFAVLIIRGRVVTWDDRRVMS